jgi:MoxR-like ATPase
VASQLVYDPENLDTWRSIDVSNQILGRQKGAIEQDYIKSCASRLARLVQILREAFIGLNIPSIGYVTDWLLATLIARENALMIGPPGVAKSEIATSLLKLIGLEPPLRDPNDSQFQSEIRTAIATGNIDYWLEQVQNNNGNQRYFHYLLSRFTQPEELFGPIEINLLKLGILARVNLGLMTGPGVRAAFLDEIFKASSSILNTLLTLSQERMYFNWGGMVKSDLIFTIGASNEMPGGFATGTAGIGTSGEDFQILYAFLDRFPVRLYIPPVEANERGDLRNATLMALNREAERFVTGRDLAAAVFAQAAGTLPVINDILLLGRALMQDRKLRLNPPTLFRESNLSSFDAAFFKLAGSLQDEGTSIEIGRISWTINPRKLRAIYKIALAHALVRQCEDVAAGKTIDLSNDDLYVFKLIWDAQGQQRLVLDMRIDELLPIQGM